MTNKRSSSFDIPFSIWDTKTKNNEDEIVERMREWHQNEVQHSLNESDKENN